MVGGLCRLRSAIFPLVRARWFLLRNVCRNSRRFPLAIQEFVSGRLSGLAVLTCRFAPRQGWRRAQSLMRVFLHDSVFQKQNKTSSPFSFLFPAGDLFGEG